MYCYFLHKEPVWPRDFHEHTCCFFHYARFAPKIFQNHVYVTQFFLYKIPNYPQLLFFITKISAKTSSHLFSFNNFLFTTLPSSALSCTSVLRRVCLSQVTILHHYLLLNLFYRIGLLMRDLLSFFLCRCLLCFVVISLLCFVVTEASGILIVKKIT
jgi:hypothetical protein